MQCFHCMIHRMNFRIIRCSSETAPRTNALSAVHELTFDLCLKKKTQHALFLGGHIVGSWLECEAKFAIVDQKEFSVQGIWNVMLEPLMWIAVLWVTTTIVRAVQARQAQSERYWGI